MAGSRESALLRIPAELRDLIFGHIDPLDLLSLKLTCRGLRDHVEKNELLFKSIYANHLDEPDEGSIDSAWKWEKALRNFVELRRILTSRVKRTVDDKLPHLPFVTKFILSLLPYARSNEARTTAFLQDTFDSLPNIRAFCCQSAIQTRASTARKPRTEIQYRAFDERQASAKLHVFFGKPNRTSKGRSVHPYAISKVYDLRGHTPDTLWGPFLPDGMCTVDWEKMEAAMIILAWNMQVSDERSSLKHSVLLSPYLAGQGWEGVTPNSFKHIPLPNPMALDPLDFVDPYNITGTWIRIVCFLDFHEFFHYNNHHVAANEPREALDTVEAIRFIIMEITATRKEDPSQDDGQDYPVVHFKGTARSIHNFRDPNANTTIRGTVRQTKEGEIRWTSISVFDGEERWKSESIQVGGINSARGVLGHWFDKDWDVHGPIGPSGYWKISNDISGVEAPEPESHDRGWDSDEHDEDYFTDDTPSD